MNELDLNFKDIVENAMDVVIVTSADAINDPGPEIVYVNKAFTQLTGYSKNEAIGQNPRMLQGEKTDANTKREIRIAIENKQPVRVTIKNYSKSGQEYWLDMNILPLKNEQNEVTHFVAIERDVTEQKNYEQELERLSRTDPLTGLLNRRAFNEISENEFSRFKRNNDVYSVLMIDIDLFKQVNDTYGHAVGDLVIQSTAHLCETNRRLYDVLARFGGEEFCLLLPQTTKESAHELAEKIRLTIHQTSIQGGNNSISVSVSIGISESHENDESHCDVINRADDKLYQAKHDGRNCSVV